MTEERFVKGDTYRGNRRLGRDPEFGIHHLGPRKVEHFQQIHVYGDRDLRDLIIRLLNRHLDQNRKPSTPEDERS